MFLGHIVFDDGIRVSTQKIEAVQSWLRHKSPNDIRIFFVLVGNYRRFLGVIINLVSFDEVDLEGI